MKKFIAVLLAILTVFSFATFSVAAEETTETENEFTGTLYDFTAGIPRISANTEGEVTILQPGDKFQFEAITAKTKSVEVIYYPDVTSIKASNILNPLWKQKAADEKFAEITVFATSPNKYKSFYSTNSFVKGDLAAVDILGMGDVTATRDSAGKDRGEAAIDYELDGAEFIGWAVHKYTWSKSSTSKGTLELYAVWDRTAGGEDGGEEGPVIDENATPIQQALAKVIYAIDFVCGWIAAVPTALNTVLSLFITTKLKPWLYSIYGIVE